MWPDASTCDCSWLVTSKKYYTLYCGLSIKNTAMEGTLSRRSLSLLERVVLASTNCENM